MHKVALTRIPADSLDQGLRIEYRGPVDIAKAKREHRDYRECLRRIGFEVRTLPSVLHLPDSVFVEDPAVIAEDCLVMGRLRREGRQGEEALLEEALTPHFPRVFRIEPPGFLEGGDVLVANGEVFVGLSTRTNEIGAEQLACVMWNALRYKTYVFPIPQSYLHLKGEATFHPRSPATPRDVITVSGEIAHHFRESNSRLLVTDPSERFGGNCISRNGLALVHTGRAYTSNLLQNEGFAVMFADISEFEKIDGALTCLSKFFSARRG